MAEKKIRVFARYAKSPPFLHIFIHSALVLVFGLRPNVFPIWFRPSVVHKQNIISRVPQSIKYESMSKGHKESWLQSLIYKQYFVLIWNYKVLESKCCKPMHCCQQPHKLLSLTSAGKKAALKRRNFPNDKKSSFWNYTSKAFKLISR